MSYWAGCMTSGRNGVTKSTQRGRWAEGPDFFYSTFEIGLHNLLHDLIQSAGLLILRAIFSNMFDLSEFALVHEIGAAFEEDKCIEPNNWNGYQLTYCQSFLHSSWQMSIR